MCAARDDVVLFDDIPFGHALPYVANFDIALFPRQGGQGGHIGPVLPVKLIEYMAVGAPIVSYDLEATQMVAQTDSGLLADTADDFIDAVVALAGDEAERRRLGAAGRAVGSGFEWNHLVDRYRDEILDRYLA
jgi:glycosyltransferase involved in cell wall biosynthesis